MLHTLENIKKELQKHIIGHDEMIELLLIALISRGHILIEGVPGLAKTTTVKTLAKTLGVEFKRVQFTPDLLPSDILGAEIYDPKENSFRIKQGPIFTNVLLADEINRSPAKVQSALLEVMEEKQVTLGDRSFKLDEPFLVLATQNPIESQGAYELPEAQLDRFMIKVTISYNTKEEELQIARMLTKQSNNIEQVATLEELQDSLKNLTAIHIDTQLEEYMVEIINATRYPKEYGLDDVAEFLRYGAGTRGT
ncbi:MAG: AAA family ATPase, partial [Campylobacterales bacterium]